jgi:hypothetical protein
MHHVDHLEHPVVTGAVLLTQPLGIPGGGQAMVPAHTQGTSIPAGVAPDAATHFPFPESEFLFNGQFFKLVNGSMHRLDGIVPVLR